MELGKVVGNVWATKKEETLNGQKLLIVQIMNEHNQPVGQTVIAADRIGAGSGDQVLIVRGSSARNAVLQPNSSIDAAVVGIIDSVVVEEYE